MEVFQDVRGAIVGILVTAIITNRKKIVTRIKGLFLSKKKVRMSLSYLFSIKIFHATTRNHDL